jgi:uncharacterized protein
MENSEELAIVSLMDKDPELKRYYDEHQAFEKQLAALHHKGHLSVDEELEIKRIQKLKLAGKDKMMELLGKHRQFRDRSS